MAPRTRFSTEFPPLGDFFAKGTLARGQVRRKTLEAKGEQVVQWRYVFVVWSSPMNNIYISYVDIIL